jgi:hypothetical protein
MKVALTQVDASKCARSLVMGSMIYFIYPCFQLNIICKMRSSANTVGLISKYVATINNCRLRKRSSPWIASLSFGRFGLEVQYFQFTAHTVSWIADPIFCWCRIFIAIRHDDILWRLFIFLWYLRTPSRMIPISWTLHPDRSRHPGKSTGGYKLRRPEDRKCSAFLRLRPRWDKAISTWTWDMRDLA